ncbi:Uncharacterised protein [Mycobacteroides abscessus subsp. massiliense]|nr:Uncharacterised protein [Mycobacteroides abscessus subsp. massiliense]
MGDDGFGQGLGHPGYACKQWHRGRVQVHTHRVHGILDDGIEAARQGAGGDIVLVLTDTDGLGFDLHQLGQRVLQTPRDRDRASQGHIEVGKLVCGIGRGRVDRRAGLADHRLGGCFGARVLDIGDEFCCQCVGFA